MLLVDSNSSKECLLTLQAKTELTKSQYKGITNELIRRVER